MRHLVWQIRLQKQLHHHNVNLQKKESRDCTCKPIKPVADFGGVPWSVALAVRLSSMSSVSSCRSEVKVMSPVSASRETMEVSSKKLQQDVSCYNRSWTSCNVHKCVKHRCIIHRCLIWELQISRPFWNSPHLGCWRHFGVTTSHKCLFIFLGLNSTVFMLSSNAFYICVVLW